MKLRKIAAASLAAVLAAMSVAVVASAEVAIFNPDKTIVNNGVKYHIFYPGKEFPNGTVIVDMENDDITEAVILPEIEGMKVMLIGGASDMGGWGFTQCTKLEKVVLPKDSGFCPPSFGMGTMTGIKDIYYQGSQEEWEKRCKT